MARLAFVGPQRSGKTATAKAVGSAQETTTVIAPFSRGVLQEVFTGLISASGRLPDKMLLEEVQAKYESDKELFRPLIVAWGMFKRTMAPDYWIQHWERTLADALQYWGKDCHIFVDDCRFPNEYDKLREMGFTFIRLAGNPEEAERNFQESVTQEPELYSKDFEVDHTIPWMSLEDRVEIVEGILNELD